ncbi:MAG: sodium:proton antiporter [Alphaproteobacteria bacterium]|nr:sodium:proton antiporter [Alphaproteobacteria bacterium]
MTPFQIIALLLIFVAVGGTINHQYFRLPATIGHMTFALILSLGALILYKLGLFDIMPVKAAIGGINFSEVLLHGMLSFLLFAGALQISLDDLKSVGTPVAVLATAGVLMATLITGTLVWAGAQWLGIALPYIYALLFGALISPTDPIAVLAIMKDAGLSKKLYAKIGSESLFNDGVGVVIFLTLLGIASGEQALDPRAIAILLAQQSLGGLALGFLIGWVTESLLQRLDDYKVEALLTLALVTGGTTLAEFLHVSAPICMVAAGLTVGNSIPKNGKRGQDRERVDIFWELLDEIFNAVLFMLIGFELIVITITGQHLLLGGIAVGAMLLGRLVSVSIPIGLMSLQQQFEKGTIPLLVWGGLRGGLSIAMALSLPDGPEKGIILPVTYVVVLFSILVQGLSFRKFLAFITK